MSKKFTQLTELTEAAQDDYLAVVDTSAGTTKKISVANLVGNVDLGWVATGESWSYSSWDSDTRTGEITVPTDATTKYTAGMRIRISQSTGGTKYGIITKVAATTLTVFFPTSTTLENEAISSPVYSTQKIPLGFPADHVSWSLEVSSSSSRSLSVGTTAWQDMTDAITIPIGAWHIFFKAKPRINQSSSSVRNITVTLSSDGSTETDSKISMEQSGDTETGAGQASGSTQQISMHKLLASETTFTMLAKLDQTTGVSSAQVLGAEVATVMTAVCDYL